MQELNDWKRRRRLCLAPMVDVTTVPMRRLVALAAPKMTLFTEMQRPEGVPDVLGRVPSAAGSVAQLSGRDPQQLAALTSRAVSLGHDEINLNLGCPGRTMTAAGCGVSLMREPKRVHEILVTMRRAAGDVPVTLKTRLGLGLDFDQTLLDALVHAARDAGCTTISLHMRNAVLDPAWSSLDNRNVPPLNEQLARSFVQKFPDLRWVMNGGLRSAADVERVLQWADGAMIGRAIAENPLAAALFHDAVWPSTAQGDPAGRVTRIVCDYVAWARQSGLPASATLPPLRQALGFAEQTDDLIETAASTLTSIAS